MELPVHERSLLTLPKGAARDVQPEPQPLEPDVFLAESGPGTVKNKVGTTPKEVLMKQNWKTWNDSQYIPTSRLWYNVVHKRILEVQMTKRNLILNGSIILGVPRDGALVSRNSTFYPMPEPSKKSIHEFVAVAFPPLELT